MMYLGRCHTNAGLLRQLQRLNFGIMVRAVCKRCQRLTEHRDIPEHNKELLSTTSCPPKHSQLILIVPRCALDQVHSPRIDLGLLLLHNSSTKARSVLRCMVSSITNWLIDRFELSRNGIRLISRQRLAKDAHG